MKANKRCIIKKILLGVFFLMCCIIITPQLLHQNKGESIAKGDYNRGSLANGYLLPCKGSNFSCYSWFSYYLLGREYIHSKVYRTIISSYADLEKLHPGRTFIYMEAAKRKGGSMFPHRTHQIGLSIDFMSPLIKKGEPKYFARLGILRYGLNFDKNGISKMNADVHIDFNLIAEHLLILNKNAAKQGLRIKKVIFNIDLKDDLYQTTFGEKLKQSGIYLAQNLTPLLNKLHDDHYHVDFELL